MPAPDYGHIRAEQVGAVLHITLNRPEARNAMSLQMVAELQQALRAAEATAGTEGAVRVVLLRGAGGHFCAGADLKDMAGARMRSMQREAGSPEPIAEVNAAFGRLCVAFAQTPLAVVAVLEGTVMGGGFGLACVADVALADDTASFRLPETSLGVVPAQIAPFLVERLGYSQAKRLAVTGGRLDAAAAHCMGLVHELCSADDLQQALNRVLNEILACAPGAVAATKALMQQARFSPASDLVGHAAAVFANSAQSAEGLEGMTAFLQKRKPTWAVI
ncbi:enoyl-CoA hydratase-related protein [Rhodoferax sp.]|uniref:enoyl-CoA hydratase/isomerase family protein n=1 Tax=Rhodoferax sp. TaxID=50421 RepID=UPI0025E8D118|nr:enoyl-CoA hydratase-related protein [Rhodoferax sp.]